MNRLPIKPRHLLFLLWGMFACTASAQTLNEARALYDKGEFAKAKPAFKKLVKSQPSNGNYNLWYGVCCMQTGEASVGVKYLETAVKRRATGGQLYLGQCYNALYRFEDAADTFEKYITELNKRKRPTAEAEQWLEKSKANLRMLKGVEEVCVVDSFVVDKANFLQAYQISAESGKLHTYSEYFKQEEAAPGTVFETELVNKIYYGQLQADSTMGIVTRNKQIDGWSNPIPLPDNINAGKNANYPYVLTDGLTLYYACDGEESMGGYDIFVTRYNTNTNSYLAPENVGMPFNSPYNDYMYVVDEYSNLGWFASDRYQPADKVCVYLFIPNSSKQVYSYEDTDTNELIQLAQLSSIAKTWKNEEMRTEALERLKALQQVKPQSIPQKDFEFVVDDHATYYQLGDFRQQEAKQLFVQYQQLEKSHKAQYGRLQQLRDQYAAAPPAERERMRAAIIDLENNVLRIAESMSKMTLAIRKAEKK